MSEVSALTSLNAWIGVAVALIGTLITAPNGFKLILGKHSTRITRARRWVRHKLARIFPGMRRSVYLTDSARVAVTLSTSDSVSVSGRMWPAFGSHEEKIEALRLHINELDGQLAEVAHTLRAETVNRDAAVRELNQQLLTGIAALRDRISGVEEESARIDARGLPVVAAGIILSGVPSQLAATPWHLGWVWLTAGIALAVVASAETIRTRERRAARQGDARLPHS